jgi:hypothetical protein
VAFSMSTSGAVQYLPMASLPQCCHSGSQAGGQGSRAILQEIPRCGHLGILQSHSLRGQGSQEQEG